MANVSLSDFTSIINNQIKAHHQLTDHLVQIEGIFDFTLTSDWSQASPAALQAQLMTMDKLIHEASQMNAALQVELVGLLPQLTSLEQA